MSELKACPFCKSKVTRINVQKTWDGKTPPNIHHPAHKRCYLATEDFYEDEWQTRPIEDALQARNDELVAFIESSVNILLRFKELLSGDFAIAKSDKSDMWMPDALMIGQLYEDAEKVITEWQAQK